MEKAVEEIISEVIPILTKFTKPDMDVTADSHLMHDLDLDSVKVMELMMELEDHFDISIPLNALPDVNTVAELASEIAQLKSS
jgi:acyl carrier protein